VFVDRSARGALGVESIVYKGVEFSDALSAFSFVFTGSFQQEIISPVLSVDRGDDCNG
jgi:hypothetical protein